MNLQVEVHAVDHDNYITTIALQHQLSYFTLASTFLKTSVVVSFQLAMSVSCHRQSAQFCVTFLFIFYLRTGDEVSTILSSNIVYYVLVVCIHDFELINRER